MPKKKKYIERTTGKITQAVVVGCSAGGIQALISIFAKINRNLSIPIIAVQHISPKSENYLVNIFSKITKLHVKEVDDKEILKASTLYLAPPNYHVLVEENFTLSLSTEERVSFARPSIDVLFESAAYAFREQLTGIILTGANQDGIEGLKTIKEFGGKTIVQNPATAASETMPKSAIEQIDVDEILTLEEIGDYLLKHF